MDYTIGCDPELFVKEGANFVPAVGMVPGTKNEPHAVAYGSVQVDGLALEVGITPARTPGEFTHNLDTVLAKLYDMLPDNVHIVDTAVAEFDAELLENVPPEALQLGCDPDYNAYTLGENPPPVAPGNKRVAGGHIHVGWTHDEDIKDPGHFHACAALARQMDVCLGVPSILEDTDKERREMYGQAGAFRPKPYGMEYRTLSNYWLFSVQTQQEVYQRARHALTTLVDDKLDYTSRLGMKDGIPVAQYIINNAHDEMAMSMCKLFSFGWLTSHDLGEKGHE